MHDRRCGKCGASFRNSLRRLLGNEGHHHELQSDQRTRSPSNDYVEALPFGELWHVVPPRLVDLLISSPSAPSPHGSHPKPNGVGNPSLRTCACAKPEAMTHISKLVVLDLRACFAKDRDPLFHAGRRRDAVLRTDDNKGG